MILELLYNNGTHEIFGHVTKAFQDRKLHNKLYYETKFDEPGKGAVVQFGLLQKWELKEEVRTNNENLRKKMQGRKLNLS